MDSNTENKKEIIKKIIDAGYVFLHDITEANFKKPLPASETEGVLNSWNLFSQYFRTLPLVIGFGNTDKESISELVSYIKSKDSAHEKNVEKFKLDNSKN